MRRRLAPVARRIAISRRRPTPRASSRFATFEQAIHNSAATITSGTTVTSRNSTRFSGDGSAVQFSRPADRVRRRGRDARRAAGIAASQAIGRALPQQVQLRRRVVERSAVAQPPDQGQVLARRIGQRRRLADQQRPRRQRHPQRRTLRPGAVEAIRATPTIGEGMTVDRDGAADHARVALHPVAPEAMIEDGDTRVGAGLRQRPVEESTEARGHVQRGEVVLGHGRHHRRHAHVAGGDLHRHARDAGEPLERRRAVAQPRQLDAADARPEDDAVRLGHAADRLPEQRVDQAEDGGVQADAEGQRDHRQGGEPRRPPEAAEQDSQVRGHHSSTIRP